MKISGKVLILELALCLLLFSHESNGQRFSTITSTDCGNININFAIKGGLEFCEGDTITLTNSTAANFDYFIIDWSEGKLDTVYDKSDQKHVYYFPDSVLCAARPLAVYFLAVKNCGNNKQTRVWGAYGINHIYRPLAGFHFEMDSVCFGKKVCMKSNACNADSIVWNFNNESINTDSCFTFNTAGSKPITMMVFNKCASDTVTQNINVVQYPSARVNISSNVKNNSVCRGDTVTFTNISNPWSTTEWTLPPLNDKLWMLDSSISNQEKSLPYDTIVFLDTLKVIVLDTGLIKFRMISTNPCDSITWDYNLQVVESAILSFTNPPRFCETADFTPELFIIGTVDQYNWSFPGGNPTSSLQPNPKNIQYSKPGIYTVILSAINSCGTSVDSVTIYVDPRPTLTLDSVKIPLCMTAGKINVKANLPNGIWTGMGVDSNGVFDPFYLPAGSYSIKYHTQSGGCMLSDSIEVLVVDTTIVDVLPLDLCSSTLPTMLTAIPAGGNFMGPGINAFGDFDPSLTGLGEFTVLYNYKDANGCLSRTSAKVNVQPPPVISKKDTLIVCIGIDKINFVQDFFLQPNPGGGQFTFILNGKPVNPIINTLNYTEGIYPLIIQYRIDLCNVQDTAILIFIQPPILQISRDTILCDRDGILRLKTNVPGGNWSGPGVNPNTGLIDLTELRTDTAVYHYAFKGGTACEATAQCTIIIDDRGKGIFAGPDIEFCKNNVTQHTLTGFLPSGGTWKGPGILDDTLGIIELVQLLVDSNYTYHYCFYKASESPCTFCDSVELIIHSLPQADFDIIGDACLHKIFTVANTSPGTNTYWWDFGDGTTSTLHSPVHSYSDTGKHTLSLTVTNSFGCSSQISKSLDITQNTPVASFSVDSVNGCAPFIVSLKNNSSGDKISYTWKIAGNTFTDSLPVIRIDGITKDSTFKIELHVKNGCGISSDSQNITVRPYPQVNFGIDSFSGCTPLELHLSNTSVGNVDQYIWNMGNGNVYNTRNPPKQIYTTTDSTVTKYQIKLIGINECGIDSLVKEITVNPSNVIAFIEPSQTKICQYDSLKLRSFSTPGASIHWKIIHPSGLTSTSSDTEFPFMFSNIGNYTIILHASNCGEDEDTVLIQVLPSPQVDFDLPGFICLHDTAFFLNKSLDIGNSFWSFGDGATSSTTHSFHRYANPGTYTVSLTGYSITNNCPVTIVKEITVISAPVAKFIASSISGCAPLTVSFTNQSTGATKYNWIFSDNSSNSLVENPTHVFVNAGTYSVILQVLDTNQCYSDTFVTTITAYPTPVSDFTFASKNYCLGKDSIQFVNRSMGADSYTWQINGTTTSIVHPVFFPSDTGIVTVRLITSNVFLCRDTASHTIHVIPSPKSQFNVDKNNGCEDLQIKMTNLSLFADHYVWDFGNQNTSTSKSPSYLYKDPGHYIISLISIGNNGCPPDTSTQVVDVWPLPDADFSVQKDSLCGVPMHATFTNRSTGSANYNWRLDGIPISSDTETEYTFNKVGDYNISLSILNAQGCADSVVKTLSIYEQPIADFIMENEACENTTIKLRNLSKNANEYEWDIESIGRSNDVEPDITFTTYGEYNIQLIASYNRYCKDTLLKVDHLKIYQQPVADFNYLLDVDKNISGDVQFTNLSQNYTGQKWNFGDGLFTLSDHPLHIYSANKEFQVTLYVYHHNSGLFTCVDSTTKTIGPLWITTFYAPNAISPEYGEGEVRLFKPVGLGLETYEMSVYSPWGERVWFSEGLENNSPSESWDGSYKGSIVPQGSYTWLAKITFINGNKKIAKGTVTVLR